jgi:5-formyltetrahydrofolate cyclo-ligase
LYKSQVRSALLWIRDRLPADARREKSVEIGTRLFADKDFMQAGTVLFFVGFGSEVETLPMIEAALRQGKRVVAPKVVKGKLDLELRRIERPEEELVAGAMGILEPREDCPEIPLEEIQLIIVPAVAWDEKGYRVGYGGGFYDHLLAQSKALRLGLGLECQILPKVPHYDKDLPVDKLITEDRLRKFHD